MHSKVLAIDFFLMQIGNKENCSKLQRGLFLITTTVEPVGNVAGSKALCVQCLLCCALCYSSARRLIKCRGQRALLSVPASLMDAIIEKRF